MTKAERDRLLRAGAQLSNICLNLRQRPGEALRASDVASMAIAQQEWDEALNAYSKRAVGRRKQGPR